MEQSLWYKKPATEWTEALPIGNGRLGAMLYGGVSTALIELNEDSLWSGYPKQNNEDGCAPFIMKARDLALKGEYAEAQACIEDNVTGEFVESYMPLGALQVQFPESEVEDYRRELSLSTAIHTVSYRASDTTYKREVYASYPDQAIIMQLTRDGKAAISFNAHFDSQLHYQVRPEKNQLILDGLCPSHVEPDYISSDSPVVYDRDHPGIQFRCILTVKTDGMIDCNGNSLSVYNATYATLFITARSNYIAWNVPLDTAFGTYKIQAVKDAQNVLDQQYNKLRKRHLCDYQTIFQRVALHLSPDRSDLPTDERLMRYQDDFADPGLAALMFDYGRYLLISSSRSGTFPANLQGIWNNQIRPPWGSNYTTNINLQMNYWPALPCGLWEVTEPLHRFVQNLSQAGQETAKKYYNARGFAVHHNVDIWCHCNPVGRRRKKAVQHDFWPLAGGWLALQVYAYYCYTNDQSLLKSQIYPCLKQATLFYIDMLHNDGEGYLSFVPSTSPENVFMVNGSRVGLAKTATMSDAIIRETLMATDACAKILNCDEELHAQLQNIFAKLRPYKIGTDERLLEWNEAFEECEVKHRHISHLFGLYPARQISVQYTPHLAEACRKTLLTRTDEGTGWSLAWKLCLWARLHDGKHALQIFNRQMRMTRACSVEDRHLGGGTYPNLLDAHPPFQIDGNFGTCAGIVEMLVQYSQGMIELLPALPSQWGKGVLSNIRVPNGLRVSLSWDEGRLLKARIYSNIEQEITVIYKSGRTSIKIMAGEALDVDGTELICSKADT